VSAKKQFDVFWATGCMQQVFTESSVKLRRDDDGQRRGTSRDAAKSLLYGGTAAATTTTACCWDSVQSGRGAVNAGYVLLMSIWRLGHHVLRYPGISTHCGADRKDGAGDPKWRIITLKL